MEVARSAHAATSSNQQHDRFGKKFYLSISDQVEEEDLSPIVVRDNHLNP